MKNLLIALSDAVVDYYYYFFKKSFNGDMQVFVMVDSLRLMVRRGVVFANSSVVSFCGFFSICFC